MKGVAKLVTDPRLKQKLKETTGIGTEATRANIISGLLARGYLLKKGRAVRASDAAFTLIDAVPTAIAAPGTTAVWEQALDMIETGTLTLETFIEKQSTWVTQLVQQYRGSTLLIKLPEGPACPLCGSVTRQRTGKTGSFWSCSRYPDCKGTAHIDGSQSRAKRHSARKPRRWNPVPGVQHHRPRQGLDDPRGYRNIHISRQLLISDDDQPFGVRHIPARPIFQMTD